MNKALIIGGANGIGLSLATELAKKDSYETIYIVDKSPVRDQFYNKKFIYHQFDLRSADYSFFDQFTDVNTLIITAGFARLSLFKDVDEDYIMNSFQINTLSAIRIIKHFYDKILDNNNDFYCGVMVSIAGFMSSPFYATYAASKAALKIFIESINVELLKAGTTNQILNISPGSIKGTSFHGGETDLSSLTDLTQQIIYHLKNKKDLFIPQYNEIFKNVLQRYHDDFRKEGIHSYEYKLSKINKL